MTPSERINKALAMYESAKGTGDGTTRPEISAMLRVLGSVEGQAALEAAIEIADAGKAFIASTTPGRRRRLRNAVKVFYGSTNKEAAATTRQAARNQKEARAQQKAEEAEARQRQKEEEKNERMAQKAARIEEKQKAKGK